MRPIWVVAVAALVIAFDQLTKTWALAFLDAAGVSYAPWIPFVNIVHARNTGVNFGVLASDWEGQQILLASFAAVVSLVLAYWAVRTADRRIAWGAAVLIGGAVGNAYDRITQGAVIDFINMDCCGIGNPFAFNVADTAIFVGAVIIVIATWRSEPEQPKTAS